MIQPRSICAESAGKHGLTKVLGDIDRIGLRTSATDATFGEYCLLTATPRLTCRQVINIASSRPSMYIFG